MVVYFVYLIGFRGADSSFLLGLLGGILFISIVLVWIFFQFSGFLVVFWPY